MEKSKMSMRTMSQNYMRTSNEQDYTAQLCIPVIIHGTSTLWYKQNDPLILGLNSNLQMRLEPPNIVSTQ